MTESEWLPTTKVGQLLKWLRQHATERKLRSFGCACCHRIEHLLEEKHRTLISMSERYADGQCTADQLRQAAERAGVVTPGRAFVKEDRIRLAATKAAGHTGFGESAEHAAETLQLVSPSSKEWKFQLAMIREIFAPCFRPVAINPTWLTSTVVTLAQSIYDNRRFEDMPILADALEDAGCDNAEMLEHGRGGGEHVRGCWLVDLILAKS